MGARSAGETSLLGVEDVVTEGVECLITCGRWAVLIWESDGGESGSCVVDASKGVLFCRRPRTWVGMSVTFPRAGTAVGWCLTGGRCGGVGGGGTTFGPLAI